ncbi:hypothetical protein ACJRO7_035867 [Eucalyptus globulus]|uniref:Uncharacterized protein n=1 Tax=Eucalyptus globulus TaxID=34317 RepID=A0ABD3JJ33_EUCGL
MKSELRVPELERSGRYLGLPFDWGASKRQVFGWILNRINIKLEGWKEQLISKAGKETLLKLVVQAIPQYAMSVFKIPVSICKAIEKKIANLWWKNSDSRAGLHWKHWEIMKMRKDRGGMGFKDLITVNKALLGKQAWQMIKNPNALWSKLLKGLYFNRTDLLHAETSSNPSWGWKSLLIRREAIAESSRWSIGSGESVQIKTD